MAGVIPFFISGNMKKLYSVSACVLKPDPGQKPIDPASTFALKSPVFHKPDPPPGGTSNKAEKSPDYLVNFTRPENYPVCGEPGLFYLYQPVSGRFAIKKLELCYVHHR